MKKSFVFVIACLMFLSGCSSKTVAVVGSMNIYESDIDERISEIDKSMINDMGEDKTREYVLKGLIEQALLKYAIKSDGFDRQADIEKKWMSAKREMDLKYFFNKFLVRKEPVPYKKLMTVYNRDKEQFRVPGKIRARHILIKAGKDIRTLEQSRKKIMSILGEIKKDGSNFAQLAKKYSECTTREKGGDLGYFSKGQMTPPFDKAVRRLNKGAFTKEPVKTVYGYHLIYSEDIKKDSFTPVEDVKEYLTTKINLEKIKDEYSIKMLPENINIKKPNRVIGAVEKISLKYSNADLKKDLLELIKKKDLGKFFADKKASSRALREFLFARVFEYKAKIMKMNEDQDYMKFINEIRNQYLLKRYINESLFKDIKITRSDVLKKYREKDFQVLVNKKYGKRFKTDIIFRKQTEKKEIFPFIEQKLTNTEKQKVYTLLIKKLKKKYPVKVKS